jgi:hypothetical protein
MTILQICAAVLYFVVGLTLASAAASDQDYQQAIAHQSDKAGIPQNQGSILYGLTVIFAWPFLLLVVSFTAARMVWKNIF